MKNLSIIEKILIHYQVLTNYDDWNTLYKCSIGEEHYNRLSEKTKASNASKWKKSAEVQEELRVRQYQQHKEEEERRAREEGHRAETASQQGSKVQGVASVNFLDRDEFLAFLNEKANEITDDKLRNDYLKMLSDNMRYKEADREAENEIQRFYTPQTCETCIIYNKCKECNVVNCPK